MIIKIFRREALPQDGYAHSKASYVYQVLDREDLCVCEKFVEEFLGIERRGIGDTITISVSQVKKSVCDNLSDAELIAELDRRLAKT